MPRKKVEMSAEQFEAATTRLKRILRRCGWTIHLNRKGNGQDCGDAPRYRVKTRFEQFLEMLQISQKRLDNVTTFGYTRTVTKKGHSKESETQGDGNNAVQQQHWQLRSSGRWTSY